MPSGRTPRKSSNGSASSVGTKDPGNDNKEPDARAEANENQTLESEESEANMAAAASGTLNTAGTERQKKHDTNNNDDTKTNRNRENTGAGTGSERVQVQATLPVYAKRKVNSRTIVSPMKQPAGAQFTRAISTISCRCGTNLMFIQTNDGKPTYCYPIVERIKNDPEYGRNKWKVDFTTVQRNPDDMNEVLNFGTPTKKRGHDGDMVVSTSKKLQNIFGRFPENDQEKTYEFRKRWGEMMANVFNAPFNQEKIYGTTNKLAYFAGDLTPNDPKAERPFLSNYLTIKHTIDALEVAYGDAKTREEILADDLLLGYYFPKKVFKQVRESETRRENQKNAYSSFDDVPTWSD